MSKRLRPPQLISRALLFIILLLLPLSAQKMIRLDMGPSGLVGFVADEIVIELDSMTHRQIDLGAAAQTGLTGITTLDQTGMQYHILSMIQRFPGAEPKIYKNRRIDLRRWFKLRFAQSIDPETLCEQYVRIPGVREAQPIGIHYVDIIPNDGFFSQQWHLEQPSDIDVDAPEAWDFYSGDPSIIVGILDSGVRYYHRDLGGATASYTTPLNSRGNMWINTIELNAGIPNGSDDDGNSYIDDWIGWDFVTGISASFPYFLMSGEDYDTPDNDPADFNGHGTHCSGNVAAINNNGYASSAVAGGWGDGTLQVNANGVRVMALRIGYSLGVLPSSEVGVVRMDFAADALYYAANNGARIVSCSWGSSGTGGLPTAIDYFLASGGLIFKSAGNDGISTADYICGRTDQNILSVAATDTLDLKADFSNYGSWVDISAPGTEILSSYHVHSVPANDYVAWLSGTSMAAPIAAATAALIWSANPTLSAEQVRDILLNNTEDINPLNPTYAGLLGAGRVNAYRPLLDPSLPVELASFTAQYDSGVVNLAWETFSELDNLGFEITRRTGETGPYQTIASWQYQPALMGLGNSTVGKQYDFTDSDIIPGSIYDYLLYDVDYNGKRTAHGPVTVDLREGFNQQRLNGRYPNRYMLYQNYPNPFNPVTTIEFHLPRDTHVTLKIFNILGEEITTLLSASLLAGSHSIEFDATQLASGIYFYRLEAEDYIKIRKMILMR